MPQRSRMSSIAMGPGFTTFHPYLLASAIDCGMIVESEPFQHEQT